MKKVSFKNSFIGLCKKKKYEKNVNQIQIVESLEDFIKVKKNFFNLFSKSKKKLCFYLHGGVGLGKT